MSAKYKKTTKLWVCPWGNTAVDKIAPIFKNISQQYYYMLREILSSNPEREFVLSRAASFDEKLKTFLRYATFISFLHPFTIVEQLVLKARLYNFKLNRFLFSLNIITFIFFF